ncbi:MAG: hypothetical protein ACREA0_29515, partial [bacterium]
RYESARYESARYESARDDGSERQTELVRLAHRHPPLARIGGIHSHPPREAETPERQRASPTYGSYGAGRRSCG